MESSDLEIKVRQAIAGDKDALEAVIRGIQDRVYNFSLRMLAQPADAEDATQEILVRVITRLESFRGESSFFTWVWRVAANQLLYMARKGAGQPVMTFEECEALIGRQQNDAWAFSLTPAERNLAMEEVRISCLMGLMRCLDFGHRLAYILGEVFELDGRQSAWIMEITPAAYRQRLSRSRKQIETFMLNNCSLIQEGNPCECLSQAGLRRRRYTDLPCKARHDQNVLSQLSELSLLRRTGALFRSLPEYRTPLDMAGAVKNIIESGKYAVLNRDSELKPRT